MQEREPLSELTRTLPQATLGESLRTRPGRLALTGPFGSRVFELTPGSARIIGGRGSLAQVRIDDPSVSATHFELVPGIAGTVLRDLGSTNGTWIAGVRIHEVELVPGTGFTAGRVSLQLDTIENIARAYVLDPSFEHMLGPSDGMRELFAMITRLAPTPLDVLVHGETGTGKELVARALHRRSAHAHGPFVVLDCSALPAALAESAIHGHAKGAFTGAHAERVGAFEQASCGTLFIDEIGELPLALQPKLLRVLDRREVTRIGEHRARPVDVRLVAATHRDLREMIAGGLFREDLYQRLAQCTLELAPLRERDDDVVALARGLLAELGNVRELRNVITRAAQLCVTESIDAVDLELHGPRLLARQWVAEPREPPLPLDDARRAFDSGYLAELLAWCGGNVSEAARIANVTRRGLQKMIERSRGE